MRGFSLQSFEQSSFCNEWEEQFVRDDGIL